MTAPLSSCPVFNCPMPQGLLGASWAGLNVFSTGGGGDRALVVSGAGVWRRDGEGADEETMGSRVVGSLPLRCREERELL